ncbi:MAG: very short patch repair endonuclease [Smithella sp.]
MDIWSKQKRSEVMSHIRSRDTKPELIIRSMLHKMGFRFRLHRRDLPGCPDIVLPKYKAIIFVHGCFWHLHDGCRDGTIPKTYQDKWKYKLERNVQRDKIHIERLQELGWNVLVIWECEIEKELDSIKNSILKLLKNT